MEYQTIIILWAILGVVKSQDPQNYFFTPSSPAQGRFVPSFGNARPSSFLSGSRNSVTNTASSYADQLIFIRNDGPSAPQSAQLTTGFAHFPQHLPLQQTTRNPDYFDISPRPFGLSTGSHSFTRSKALRPSSSAFGNLNSQQTNAPHQQTQFLAHFDHNAPVSSSAATSNFQSNRINGGVRPSVNGGGSSNSAFNRNRSFPGNNFTRQQQTKEPLSSNEDVVTPVQQLPFRNTRTRFLPASSKSSTTTTSTSKPSRYNRFGPGRSENRLSTTTAPLRVRPASYNKTLFQPRRPVIISREINRPFGAGGGRISINHNGSVKHNPSEVNEQRNDDLDGSYEDDTVAEEIHDQNHVNESEVDMKIFEKLSLHEAGAPVAISSSTETPLSFSGALPPTIATSEKGQDDHTVILTSNFYLPGSFEDDEEVDEDDDSVDVDNVPTSKENEEDTETSATTQQPNDYDYEQENAVTTDAPKSQNTDNDSVEFTTELNPEVEEESEMVTDQEWKSEVEKLVTESPALSEITTLAQVSSAEYGEHEEYEYVTGSGSGLEESEDYSEDKTEKISDSKVVGREVVSVVTTKSVINGSTAVPQSMTPSTVTEKDENIYKENKIVAVNESSKAELNTEVDEQQDDSDEEQYINNTTESYVVIASIQTSRSINGARFLPFPAIEQEETKQTLSELERKIHGKISRKRVNQSNNESNETASSNELQVDTYSKNTTISDTSEKPFTEHETKTQATTAFRFVPNIRKFMPKTSPKPKINIDDIPMDDLTGLLPAGFKPRPSYKNKKINKFTSSTTESTNIEEQSPKPQRNSTISRSYKNSLNAAQEVALAGLLPKGYRTTPTPSSTPAISSKNLEDVLTMTKFEENLDKFLPADYKDKITTPKTKIAIVDEISTFLPPGFKLPTNTNKPIVKVEDDVSKFLPPGFKPPTGEQPEIKISIVHDLSKLLPPGFKLESSPKEEPVDISKLLPKDFKPAEERKETESTFSKNVFKNVSALLPSGFIKNSSDDVTTTQSPTTSSSGFKLVFPKGLNKRPGQRLTTPRTGSGDSNGGTSTSIVIKKGPPMRVTTEFTGWPTPSTTPISIEKLLEQSRTATIDISELLPQTSTTSTSTTTTTTTTPEPPRPTKPGHCRSDCDLAGTIRIIDGVTWKPELLDHNTVEWKNLAREVEAQLNEVYSNAPRLSRWYKKVRIDSFSKGSVLVDYFVELANITQDVNTLEIKKMFHQALTQSPLPVVPLQSEVDIDNDASGEFMENKDGELVKETYLMGRFVVDPASTDFIVIPKSLSPTVEFAEEDALIPHWAIVLIVIGIGSLCFVVIFGVTVLLNRQKRAKKAPIPLTADMMNDLKVNHMGGADNYGVDDFYNIDDAWNDTKQPIKPKRFTNSIHGSSGSNIYDSWRSTRHGDYYYDSHNYTPHAKSEQYPPDAFADVHQMYTYNNSRSRYQRDYDPDF